MWFYQLTSHLLTSHSFKNIHFTHKNNIPYFWVDVKLRKQKHGKQVSISSRTELFDKKSILWNFANSQENTCAWGYFLIKLQLLSKTWKKYSIKAKLVNITPMCLVALSRFCFRKTTWKTKLSEIFYH